MSSGKRRKAESEAEFSKRVVELARRRGWSYQRTVDGLWAASHTSGFPDLTLVRGREVIFAELKTDRGHLSAAQSDLHEAWRKGGRRIRVWRPRDWADIEDALR